MIVQILGVRRLVILGALIVLNGVLGATLYYGVIPQREKVERDLRMVRSAVDTRRNEVTRMRTEFDQIQEQKGLFENLESAGFFGTQNRLEARRIIETIQSTSRVLSARYSIDPANVVETPDVKNAGHVLLQSPVRVTIDAMDDVDIYSFLYWIENAFPGQASIKGFTLERRIDVNEHSLRQIGSGTAMTLVSGEVSFVWTTMAPKDSVSQQPGQPGRL